MVAYPQLKMVVVIRMDNTAAVGADIENDVLDLLEETANFVHEDAVDEAPEDLGKLKAENRVVSKRGDHLIVFDALNEQGSHHYPFFVEKGTRFMDAQPFLVPAMVKGFQHFEEGARGIFGKYS